jgi:hypothetical protein
MWQIYLSFIVLSIRGKLCVSIVSHGTTYILRQKWEDKYVNMHTDCYYISVIFVGGGLGYEMRYLVHNMEMVNPANTEYFFRCFIFKELMMSTGEAPQIILIAEKK